LTITFKGNNFNNKTNNAKSTENKAKKYRVIIPQWLVINTEYRDFNSNFQLEINTITATIGEINKNIPKIIDEIVQMEKTIMIHRWNIFISLFLYLNKSLPLRIVYSKIKGLSPGAKKTTYTIHK